MSGFGWGLLLGLLVGLGFWMLDAELQRRHRRRRRGGWLKPRASWPPNLPETRKLAAMVFTDSSSSPTPHGDRSADEDTHPTPQPWNRRGEPGFSTRVPDGGGETGRTPPAPAAYAECDGSSSCPAAVHLHGCYSEREHGNTCTCPTDRPCDCPPAVRAFMEPPGANLLRRNRGDDAA